MEIHNNIEIILDPNIDVSKLKLYGVKLGNHAGFIKKDIIIPRENGQHVSWVRTTKGAHYRTNSMGFSGPMWPNNIVEFVLKEPLIGQLGIHNPEDIYKKFGKPESTEKVYSSHYYFYPKRKIVISWDIDKDKLYAIYIGENNIKPTVFTARDFLKKFHGFREITPNTDFWTLESLEENPPRYYRLLEIKSLMRAFNLGEDLLNDFRTGVFVDKRSAKANKAIYKELEAYASKHLSESDNYQQLFDEIRNTELSNIFSKLLEFDISVKKLQVFNRGLTDASTVSSRFIMHKTGGVLNSFDGDKIFEIEKILLLFIAPKKQTFTKSELLENYDYPDVDISDIDFEWLSRLFAK